MLRPCQRCTWAPPAASCGSGATKARAGRTSPGTCRRSTPSKWPRSRDPLRRMVGRPMKVLIPGALRSYTREAQVEAVGDTLDLLFADLDRRYPGLRFRVIDEQNQLRPNMRVFVNGVGVRELRQELQPDDF